jgi:hypothetical protein
VRKAFTIIALCFATFLALGGVAFASIPGPDGLIHGCYRNTSGDMRVIDSEETCQSNETPLNWDQTDTQRELVYHVDGLTGTIPAGTIRAATAICPSGTQVVSGGFIVNDFTLDIRVIRSSYPGGEPPTQWVVWFRNHEAFDVGDQAATAICTPIG